MAATRALAARAHGAWRRRAQGHGARPQRGLSGIQQALLARLRRRESAREVPPARNPLRELAAARIIALHPASGGGVMIVVIFEVIPNEGRAHEYFDLAQELAPELDKIDGFISVERFESLADKGKFLSLSTWRDEAAVAAWYHHSGHRKAQAKGKA